MGCHDLASLHLIAPGVEGSRDTLDGVMPYHKKGSEPDFAPGMASCMSFANQDQKKR